MFKELIDRSIGSGLSLLMFRDDNNELIGIRMTSIFNRPRNMVKKEFVLLPDYKEGMNYICILRRFFYM
jgi:hypothetical protein